MQWKNLPATIKGGIIGFLVTIILVGIPYFMIISCRFNPCELGVLIPVAIMTFTAAPIVFPVHSLFSDVNPYVKPTAIFILSIILYTSIGVLFGYLSSKRKSK